MSLPLAMLILGLLFGIMIGLCIALLILTRGAAEEIKNW